MALQTENPIPQEEEDYDVIIEGADIGDPIAVFALGFVGKKAPTELAPWKHIEIKISLYWKKVDKRIDIGTTTLSQVTTQGPYTCALPYDDKYFRIELDYGVPTSLYLTVSAQNSLGKHIRPESGTPLGNGKYVISYEDIKPQHFGGYHDFVESLKGK